MIFGYFHKINALELLDIYHSSRYKQKITRLHCISDHLLADSESYSCNSVIMENSWTSPHVNQRRLSNYTNLLVYVLVIPIEFPVKHISLSHNCMSRKKRKYFRGRKYAHKETKALSICCLWKHYALYYLQETIALSCKR